MRELDDELRKKIIKEQDSICHHAEVEHIIKYYIDNDSEYASDITEKMLEDEEIYNNLSIRSLCSLLNGLTTKERAEERRKNGSKDVKDDQELIDKICERIEEKMETEDFYYNDSDDVPSFTEFHTSDFIVRKMTTQLHKKVMDTLQVEFNKLKDSEVGDISTKTIDFWDFANFYHSYKEGIITQQKADTLRRMYEKNPHAYEHFNFGVLKDEIYNKVPEEMIELTSKFPSLGRKMLIIQETNPKLFEVFANRVNSYDCNLLDKYNEIDEMSLGFLKIANDIEINEVNENSWKKAYNYGEFVKQQCDFSLSDYTKGEPIDYTKDFKEEYTRFLDIQRDGILAEKYGSDNYKIDRMLNICFKKQFTMTRKEAKKLLDEYAGDLDNIEGIDSQKAMIKEIESALEKADALEKAENLEDVKNLYESLEQSYDFADIAQTKETISRECAKTFGEKLEYVDNKVQDAIDNKEEGIYEQVEVDGQKVDIVKMTGKFDLFLHSTDSGFLSDKKLDENHNFKDAWESGETKTNHILSTAYVNQDFMGSAPVGPNGVMYAFSNVPRENIKLMGVSDLNTYTKKLGFNSAQKQYMTANTMANASRRVYSEFALEKSDPSYVVLMDDMSEEVKQNTLKAAKDFGIPVLRIDKEEIVKQQVQDLNELVDKLEKTNDPEVLSHIINKYETNVSGWLLNRKEQKDESHTQNIDNSRFKDYFKEVEARIQDATTKYIENTKDNPDSLTKIAEALVREQDLYELSRHAGPDKKITGTELSHNARGIMAKVNEEFKNRGMEDFVVTQDTNLKQYLKMKEVAKNAVCRERTSMKQVDKSRQVEEIQKDEQNKNIE